MDIGGTARLRRDGVATGAQPLPGRFPVAEVHRRCRSDIVDATFKTESIFSDLISPAGSPQPPTDTNAESLVVNGMLTITTTEEVQ